MKPAFYDNILACYPALIARLEQVEGVRKVLEAEDLASIGDKQAPLDGAVYVALDGFSPLEDNNARKEQTIEIGFSIILCKRAYSPRPKPFGVGETLTALCRALQGFDPEDERGRALTTSPFKQTTALAIEYQKGWAFFPLRFICEVAIIQDKETL